MSPSAPETERWRLVVGVLALTEIVSWGILYYAFGVLMPAMRAELGWSQGLLGGAFSLALFVSALLAVPLARAFERHGPRVWMTAGSLTGALLLFLWARVDSAPGFYALFLLLGFPLASTLYEAAFTAVVGLLGSGRRTDVALLFLTIVAGLASTVFVPVVQALLQMHGWRTTLRILAVLLAAITVPLHATVLPRRMAAVGTPAPRSETGPDRRTLSLVAAAFALATVSGTPLGVYLVTILEEQGRSPGFAAGMASLIGVGQVLGRIGFTVLRPRHSLARWSAVLFVPPAVGLALLAGAPGAGIVALAVLAVSISAGGQTLGRAAWTLELFPLSAFARANGVVGRWSLLGRAGAPLVLGLMHDRLGSHGPGLVLVAVLTLAGGSCAALAARRRPRGSATPQPPEG